MLKFTKKPLFLLYM